MSTLPELPQNCNSWIVVDKASGRAVAEFFEEKSVRQVMHDDRYEIRTALEHLQRLSDG